MRQLALLISGIVLLILSILGFIYFRNYKGTFIPYPAVWMAICSGTLAISGWLIFQSKKMAALEFANERVAEVELFKKSAYSLPIDIDQCVFKNGSYVHYVKDESDEFADALSPSLYGQLGSPTPETVMQSYFIFTTMLNNVSAKFISPSYPCDPTTLKFYVLKNEIALFVNRTNPSKYLFENKFSDS